MLIDCECLRALSITFMPQRSSNRKTAWKETANINTSELRLVGRMTPGTLQVVTASAKLVGGFDPSEKYESQLGW